MDFLFGLIVVAAVLMSFVYISSSGRAHNSALQSVEQVLRSVKEDRPIIVLVAILGISYFILSFMGKLLIFFCGIVLPVQGLFLIDFMPFFFILFFFVFSNYSACNITKTKFS